jgi:hypothetical protein
MDPSMMGGSPAPMDPGAAGGTPDDPAVPLSIIGDYTTKIIEATKGKRTADPKDPNSMADPAAAGGPPGVANIGGAPSDTPMALPGMGPPMDPSGGGAPPGGGPMPKAAAAIEQILTGIRRSKGYR